MPLLSAARALAVLSVIAGDKGIIWWLFEHTVNIQQQATKTTSNNSSSDWFMVLQVQGQPKKGLITSQLAL